MKLLRALLLAIIAAHWVTGSAQWASPDSRPKAGQVCWTNKPNIFTAASNFGTPSAVVLTNATGLPLTTGVTGILPTANGGTGIAYFTAAGPTAARVYTFPDAAATITITVASGTSALGTSAISSGACATVVTTTATGTATTDNIMADFNADPTSTTGYSPSSNGMLTIVKYPTANNVNFKVCNNTASSITPGAVTLNWRVVR